MAEAVTRRPFTGDAPVQSKDNACDIYGGQSGSVTVLSPSTCFPLSVPFHNCPTLTLIYVLSLSEGQAGEAWGSSEEQRSFGTAAALGVKLLSLFYEPPNFTVIPVFLKRSFSRL
jgi:hypothetical protein